MLKRHGNKQINYEQYFEISKNNKLENYDIDLWFFLPQSLNNGVYSTPDFFKDFITYTRYNAPYISIEELADFTNPKNPLTRLLNIIHIPENHHIIEYELKTLLNTFKVSCERAIVIVKGMKKFNEFESVRNLKVQIDRFNLIEEQLCAIAKKAPDNFKLIYDLAIEGLSLRLEKTFYKIFALSIQYEKLALEVINNQRKIREDRGYNSITTDNETTNSTAIYREHIIKKWSESIMYINLENSKTQTGLNHLFLGSAAALAMSITGIITIIAAKYWGNDTIYLFFIAMILYSLKDRFKDIFKAMFLKQMATIFADRVKTIVSPVNRRKCGRSMERVTFPTFKELRKSIQEIRFYNTDDINIKQSQEDIIHYKKRVNIFTDKLYKNHTRLFGIKEIIRFDFRRWFDKMDKEIEKCYIPKGDKLIRVNADREYHFNLIIQIKTSKETDLKRYQIIAGSHKIKKINLIT